MIAVNLSQSLQTRRREPDTQDDRQVKITWKIPATILVLRVSSLGFDDSGHLLRHRTSQLGHTILRDLLPRVLECSLHRWHCPEKFGQTSDDDLELGGRPHNGSDIMINPGSQSSLPCEGWHYPP